MANVSAPAESTSDEVLVSAESSGSSLALHTIHLDTHVSHTL